MYSQVESIRAMVELGESSEVEPCYSYVELSRVK